MMTFYKYLLKLEVGEMPPPPVGGTNPTPGAPPAPPGGDPLAALGGGMAGGPTPPPPPGGDPMGGMGGAPPGGTPQTRKSINITTWEDALKLVLGKDAHRELKPKPYYPNGNKDKEEKPKHKSLIQ